jgi:hypothetical protein
MDDYDGQSMTHILKNLRSALLVELEQIKPEPDANTIAKVHDIQEQLVSMHISDLPFRPLSVLSL